MRLALVPRERSRPPGPVSAAAYRDPKCGSRGPTSPNNPGLWTPPGYKAGATPAAAVFFIHPTSYLDRDHWNAPLDDPDRRRARRDVPPRRRRARSTRSAQIWAPRYRQATFGAFLTSRADAEQRARSRLSATSLRGIRRISRSRSAPDRPIILAGHSQGALHLTRLLARARRGQAARAAHRRRLCDRLAGVARPPICPRSACPNARAADQAGCILSWQSFAEPADPSQLLDAYDATTGFTASRAADTRGGLHQSADRHRRRPPRRPAPISARWFRRATLDSAGDRCRGVSARAARARLL